MGFGALDYVVMATYVLATLGVGLWAGRKSAGTDDLFLAGRNQSPVMIGISLISGLTSGISYLGIPGYAYQHGLGFSLGVASYIPVACMITFLIVPFFHAMSAVSAYSYLEKRFSRRLRTAVAALFLLRVTVYLGMILYAPALAVSSLTALPEWLTVLLCGSITTAYTMHGGMTSVVYTDFMQSIMLLGGSLLILGICVHRVPTHELNQAVRWGDFFELNSAYDDSFAAMFVGQCFLSLAQGGADQIAIQRYLTTPTLRGAQWTVMTGWLLSGVFTILLCYLGVLMWAFYATKPGGQPDLSGQPDRIMPYFWEHELPAGLPGLMAAAVIGCTMSVSSAAMNSASTCCVIDLLQNALGRLLPPAPETSLIRASWLATLFFGVTGTAIALLASALGEGLIDLNQTLNGVCGGPVLAVFLLGMLSEVGQQAALCGFGLSCGLALVLGTSSIYCSGSSAQCTGLLSVGKVSVFWACPIVTTTGLVAGYLAGFWNRGSAEQLAGLTWRHRHEKQYELVQEPDNEKELLDDDVVISD